MSDNEIEDVSFLPGKLLLSTPNIAYARSTSTSTPPCLALMLDTISNIRLSESYIVLYYTYCYLITTRTSTASYSIHFRTFGSSDCDRVG